MLLGLYILVVLVESLCVPAMPSVHIYPANGEDAVIFGTAESHGGEKICLVKNPLAGARYRVMDSATTASDGSFVLRCIANADTGYALLLNGVCRMWPLGLIGGDSVGVMITDDTSYIYADRFGANMRSKRIASFGQSMDQFELAQNYDSYEPHLHSASDSLHSLLNSLVLRDPEHRYLLNYYKTWVDCFYPSRLCYFQYRYALHNGDDTVRSHSKFLEYTPPADAVPEALADWAIDLYKFHKHLQYDSIAAPSMMDHFRLAFNEDGRLAPWAVVWEAEFDSQFEDVDSARTALSTIRPELAATGCRPEILECFDSAVRLLQARETLGVMDPGRLAPDEYGVLNSIAQYKGRVIYLDYWGTWCGPCRSELPALQRLIQHYSDNSGIVFISVAIEYDSGAKWRDLVSQEHLQGVQLMARRGFDDPIVRAAAIHSAPRYMLFAKDGSLVKELAPRPEDPALMPFLDSLLKQDPR